MKATSINRGVDEENVVHVEYYSAIKNLTNAICSNMDGSGDFHTEGSKSDQR